MRFETFEEKNLVAVGMNRAQEVWDEVKLVSKYKHGRHGAEWQEYTKAEEVEAQLALASGWLHLGLAAGDRVAIMGQNRPRWIFSLNSILSAKLVAVPVYPSLTGEEAAFILQDSGARYVVADTLEQARKILAEKDSLPALEGIYVMDAYEGEAEAPIQPLDRLMELGRAHLDDGVIGDCIRSIEPESLAAIIYTSGTTGHPKGVMLSHGNFLSQRPLQSSFDLGPDDIFLNHLPFCHVFGLTADLFGSAALKAKLVIADGIEPEKIRHALHTIRPTVLMSVPRLFEKIYVQVQQVVSQKPAPVQKLIQGALDVGKAVFDLNSAGKPVPVGLAIKHRLSQRVTVKVLKQAGLERVRLAYAGGAPTSKALCHFYQGLGINLYQGYGLTETSPVATVNLPGKNKLGTVGPPIPGVEVKIAEDGEIVVRGPIVMQGYFNNPEATAEAIDSDGWFHTGDIGELDEDGYLKIVDRKKEIIITSGGKNIAPLSIESAFNTDHYIERVVVIGEGRNYLTALVCPDFGVIRQWAEERGLPASTPRELVEHEDVIQLLESRVAEVNKHLASFEQIKKIAVLEEPMTPHSGDLTPTEKLRRKVIDKKYAAIIDELYARTGNIGVDTAAP